MSSGYSDFVIYDVSGNILRTGRCSEGALDFQPLKAGESLIVGAGSWTTHKVDLSGQEPVIVSKTVNEMAPSLDDLKSALVQKVLAEFDRRVAAGFTYINVLYQITDYSRSNMTAAAVLATLALAGQFTWPVNGYPWIASDNSIQTFTAAGFVAFGAAVAAYYAAMVFNSRSLKDSIVALADATACASFDVTQGWP